MKNYHEDYFNSCGGLMVLFSGYIAIALLIVDHYEGGFLFKESQFQFFCAIILGCNSLWMTGRQIGSKIVKVSIKIPTIKNFLLKNIIAPVIVSLIVYAITGNTSITFLSIPLLGAISVTIEA